MEGVIPSVSTISFDWEDSTFSKRRKLGMPSSVPSLDEASQNRGD